MIEYKNRTYREHLQKERWYSFTVAYKETDLWIGIDQASFQESIPTFTESRIRTLREYMDAYLQNDPDYATSLVSYEAQPGARSDECGCRGCCQPNWSRDQRKVRGAGNHRGKWRRHLRGHTRKHRYCRVCRALSPVGKSGFHPPG